MDSKTGSPLATKRREFLELTMVGASMTMMPAQLAACMHGAWHRIIHAFCIPGCATEPSCSRNRLLQRDRSDAQPNKMGAVHIVQSTDVCSRIGEHKSQRATIRGTLWLLLHQSSEGCIGRDAGTAHDEPREPCTHGQPFLRNEQPNTRMAIWSHQMILNVNIPRLLTPAYLHMSSQLIP